MENGQKTIFEVFNGDKRFIIPKFQRAYAWETKHLKDFLEDIKNHKQDKQYFWGTILFQTEEVKEGFEQIYIIDGQQRITTIIIFLKVLLTILQRLDNNEEYSREIRRYLKDKDVYKIEMDNIDNDFFRTYIIEDNDYNSSTFDYPSQKRLYNAKKFFYKNLKDLSIDQVKELKEKIEKSKVLTYSVGDLSEAALIFETTNDRGKSLTNLEKTKSFLMHKAYVLKTNYSELINSIQDRFRDIYCILEEIEEDIDSEDSILQYHFISHFNWSYTKKEKDYKYYMSKFKEKVNYLISGNKTSEALSFIDDYSRELKETFVTAKEMIKNKNTHLRDVFILGRVSTFYPLLIKCYKMDKTENKQNFYDVVNLIEFFSFRVYGIGNKPNYTARDWLYKLARDFKGNFEDLKVDLKKQILKLVPDELFKEKLLSEYFLEDMDGNDVKYLLWKYENYLRTQKQPISAEVSENEFLDKRERFKLTVEHISSQTPVEKTIGDNFIHKLGNLVLDTKSSNSSKQNKDVEVKSVDYYNKSTFKSQQEIADFMIENKWTEDSINKRTEKIINFAMERWNLGNITTLEPTDKHSDNSEKTEVIENPFDKFNDFFDNVISEVKKMVQYNDFKNNYYPSKSGKSLKNEKSLRFYWKNTDVHIGLSVSKEMMDEGFTVLVYLWNQKKNAEIIEILKDKETYIIDELDLNLDENDSFDPANNKVYKYIGFLEDCKDDNYSIIFEQSVKSVANFIEVLKSLLKDRL